ncbi:hypothetical protein ACFWP7_09430 [Streptomyces sp. NPDC058470]|uniref:hypothetical protein n=1 Tax=Streptomyces sp. NPDC058470 TaxID=3346515 RepID=UPI00364B1639
MSGARRVAAMDVSCPVAAARAGCGSGEVEGSRGNGAAEYADGESGNPGGNGAAEYADGESGNPGGNGAAEYADGESGNPGTGESNAAGCGGSAGGSRFGE